MTKLSQAEQEVDIVRKEKVIVSANAGSQHDGMGYLFSPTAKPEVGGLPGAQGNVDLF